MISTLLLYYCLSWDHMGCAREEVYAAGRWEGPAAPAYCDVQRHLKESEDRNAIASGLKRYECESEPVEAGAP